MKKIIALLLALVMVMSLAACGDKTPEATDPVKDPTTQATENENPTETDPVGGETDVTEPVGSTEEPILTDTEYRLLALFNASPVEFPVMTWALNIDDAEMIKSFTGLDDITKIVEASVTEPAMSAQAYSVILVKVADGVDAAAVADEMKAGIDPRKWVCVEADEIETVIVDNYVLLVMMASDLSETVSAKSLTEAYVEMVKTYESPAEVSPAPTTPGADAPAEGETLGDVEAEHTEDVDGDAAESTEAPADGE